MAALRVTLQVHLAPQYRQLLALFAPRHPPGCEPLVQVASLFAWHCPCLEHRRGSVTLQVKPSTLARQLQLTFDCKSTPSDFDRESTPK
jgi:hypothetical protein